MNIYDYINKDSYLIPKQIRIKVLFIFVFQRGHQNAFIRTSPRIDSLAGSTLTQTEFTSP